VCICVSVCSRSLTTFERLLFFIIISGVGLSSLVIAYIDLYENWYEYYCPGEGKCKLHLLIIYSFSTKFFNTANI
jgi:hypothetical protein